jgi:3-oxoacyl-[acyl-carrier protein] reductase
MTSRAVLVTGGSRGIGAAVAAAFAERGDRVAVHYGRRSSQAEQVRDGLAGSGHVAVAADLADPDAVRRMVDDAAEALDGIDVLVNNAGVFEAHPIADTTYEEWQGAWRRRLDVNLTGAANVTWCALRHMPDGGRIVMVSSRGASAASRTTRPTARPRRASSPSASRWPVPWARAGSR